MFWESVLPTTGTIFVVLMFLVVGGYFMLTYDGKSELLNGKMLCGILMVALALSFIFACLGYAAGNSSYR